MTEFKPLRGWRYNLDKIDFGEVLAPPYDVISDQRQQALYERSDFNCIRLILNRITEQDTDQDNRYTRARDFFNNWREQSVLIQENAPAFYLYRQTFQDPETGQTRRRSAVIGRLHLEPFEKGVVVPHEKILSKPRKDRGRLLEETRTIFSPVFGLYEDPSHKLAPLLEKACEGQPLFDVQDEDAVGHTLWVLQEPALVESISAQISNKSIYIADGHHRYQTALDYGREKRQRSGLSADRQTDSDYTLIALVEFHDPGLALFATHRLIKDLKGLDTAACTEALKPYFEIQEVALEKLEPELKAAGEDRIRLGLAFGDKALLLTLKDWRAAKKQMPEGHADLWYQLDVNLISHFILGQLWKIGETEWESTIGYTHSLAEAKEAVASKSAAAAFILKAPKVEILREMGKVKELMAQKSTYFYPKLASGLVFYRHESA